MASVPVPLPAVGRGNRGVDFGDFFTSLPKTFRLSRSVPVYFASFLRFCQGAIFQAKASKKILAPALPFCYICSQNAAAFWPQILDHQNWNKSDRYFRTTNRFLQLHRTACAALFAAQILAGPSQALATTFFLKKIRFSTKPWHGASHFRLAGATGSGGFCIFSQLSTSRRFP